jgi:hypothetical protein
MAYRLADLMQRFLWLAQGVIAICVGMLGYMALDRVPPFVLLPHAPIVVHAGEWAILDVPVRRDFSRHCDVTYSRYIYDSPPSRFDLVAGAEMSDEDIRDMDRRTPGRLVIKTLIPPLEVEGHPGIALGPADLVTSLSYVCNKAHILAPIRMTTRIPLIVVP